MNTWSAHHDDNPMPGRLRRRPSAISVVLALVVSAVMAVGATDARAVTVDTAPVWPIADVIAAPPPIPQMPTAGEAPPDDQIADPVTPGAVCGGWQLQENYGGRWPATARWWEYRCTYEYYFYYNPCSGGGACNAFCPECFVEIETRTDYFYWAGSDPAFYGEDYFYDFYYTENLDIPPSTISAWWDAPTAHWYDLGYLLTVSKQGGGSGAVTSTPAGIDCGNTCQASFATGTAVTLNATADPSSTFTGWSGDCIGTGACQVRMDWTRSVVASFDPDVKELTVYKQGTGSGTVTSTPAGIDCGTTCQASFATGTAVTLIATADPTSTFTGWSGDCTGTGTCQITMDRDRWVSPTFAPIVPNQTPTPRFTVSCVGVTCHFDGRASTDIDGTVVAHWWDLGDASPLAGGSTADHAYATGGTYTVTLTVTDDGHLSASSSQLVTVRPTVPGAPHSVTARAYGTTAEVRFSAPTSDGGSPIASYTARCGSSNGGITRQAQGAASPVNVPKLSGGKTYTCTVGATNAIGTGPASAPSAPFRVPR